MDRKQIIQQLRDKRYSYARIGQIFGISRQRVHQIYAGYRSPSKYSIHPIPDELLKIRKYKREGYNTTGITLEGRDMLKEIVRRRDNHTCQVCSRVWQEGQRRLDVHHLDEELEGKEGLKYQNCKCFDRMITLCHKCHLNLESVRNKIKNGLNKVINTPPY
jgi:hypothetical protein